MKYECMFNGPSMPIARADGDFDFVQARVIYIRARSMRELRRAVKAQAPDGATSAYAFRAGGNKAIKNLLKSVQYRTEGKLE